MPGSTSLTIIPADHPDPRVRSAGFDLGHPYVEQCWSQAIGPTATLLLRRLPVLWTEGVPATVERDELSRSLGLGAGTGDASRLMRSVDRCVDHGLARWHQQGASLDVFLRVPALSARHLARSPQWTQAVHHRLLDRHIADLAAEAPTTPIRDRLDRVGCPTGLRAPARALLDR